MLAHYDISDSGAADTWRLIGDASLLAFADRDRYMADSDFVPMPVAGLIDPEYLAGRAALLRGDTALSGVEPGRPGWGHAGLRADPVDVSRLSTSHISIVDTDGNALSITTTIENSFGSRVMVPGFLLNNELTDFSFRSHRDGVPVANRVEPGKRPRSSMSPTIVLRDGKLALVVGSPGGSRIIGYVAQAVTRLYQMAVERGYRGSQSHFRNMIAPERPRPMAEAYLRLKTLPGEQAQVDWAHFGKVRIGRAERPLMGFVMVLSYSRRPFLRFYLNAGMDNFLRGHVEAFEAWQGVPRELWYDNLKSVVAERRGDAIGCVRLPV